MELIEVPPEAELVNEGDYWTVTFGGRQFRVRDSKGMRYLAELLSHAGTEIRAADLAAARDGGVTEGDLGPILDERAKTSFKHRLLELREDMESAEAEGDVARMSAAKAEFHMIAQELRTAAGLAGRDRRAGSSAERARLNVTRAIRTTIDHVRGLDPVLGEHLSRSVKTGGLCGYIPDDGLRLGWRVLTRPPRPRPSGRFVPPEVAYLRRPGGSIAYQVFGDGPVDLLLTAGVLSNLDFHWADPTFTRMLLNMAQLGRVIIYDRRGVGLSDPVGRVPNAFEAAEDACAVLDAVGAGPVVGVGLYFNSLTLAALAATHPGRVRGLVFYCPFPAGPGAAEYPGSAEVGEFVGRFRQAAAAGWGRGATLELLEPKLARNPLMRRLWGAFERASMGPGAVDLMLNWFDSVDGRDVLSAVQAPSLVVHCLGEPFPVDTANCVADTVVNGRLIVLPGDWHAPLTGDMDQLVDLVQDFVETLPVEPPGSPVLATALAIGGASDRAMRRVAGEGGLVASRQAGQMLYWFTNPSRAVRVGASLIADGLAESVALDAGLCHRSESGLTDSPLVTAAGLLGSAEPGAVIVTTKVRQLLADAGLEFVELAHSQPAAHLVLGFEGDELDPGEAHQIGPVDRAAHGAIRHAPGLSRATMRIIKGGL